MQHRHSPASSSSSLAFRRSRSRGFAAVLAAALLALCSVLLACLDYWTAPPAHGLFVRNRETTAGQAGADAKHKAGKSPSKEQSDESSSDEERTEGNPAPSKKALPPGEKPKTSDSKSGAAFVVAGTGSPRAGIRAALRAASDDDEARWANRKFDWAFTQSDEDAKLSDLPRPGILPPAFWNWFYEGGVYIALFQGVTLIGGMYLIFFYFPILLNGFLSIGMPKGKL
eukprot:TRINITY_DN58221_c0_g1_i1.p1 TRINITY_DN58221_c0_g1~~TRINITY_DN58221_c0_g1_i1.p1  ORF type:complete len:227 (+),score=55.71 TRINITY_DN58221_c0_g1_i1:109-789(+)